MSCLGSVAVDLSDRLENPGESYQLSGHIDVDGYAVGEKELTLPEGASYDVVFTNAGDGILVTGMVRAHATGECDRCLEPASFDVAGEIEEFYLFEGPRTPESYEDGFELIGPDRVIDLGDAISDAVVMDTPFVVLCKPDCKGPVPHVRGKPQRGRLRVRRGGRAGVGRLRREPLRGACKGLKLD